MLELLDDSIIRGSPIMSVRYHSAFAISIYVGLTVVCSALGAELSEATFCGLQHTDDYFRISNGTSIDEFPWLAALIYKFSQDGARAVLCSGTLINRRYVVTAAQCLTHPRASAIVAVRLGEYHIRNATDCVMTDPFGQDCTQATDFGIEEKIVHSQYNRKTRANDIALLRLDERVNEFSDYIRPICLFPNGPVYAQIGDTLHTSGWGRRFQDSEPVEIKKKINTTLITNEECAKEVSGRIVTEKQMCTRDQPTNTNFACKGDAGAPVMFVYGAVPQWHLEGITSWGAQCGPTQPQVHTRVSSYLDWIDENMSD